jgi:thioredoxin 1
MEENMEKTKKSETPKIALVLIMVVLATIMITVNQSQKMMYNKVLQEKYNQMEREKQYQKNQTSPEISENAVINTGIKQNTAKQSKKKIPSLIDLGSDSCVPCKMMAPILEELRNEYRGKLDVVFIDVWKNPEAARQYGIRVIPTQIFIDENGKEIYRHQGFISKQDILNKWKELGYDFSK